MAEPESVLFWGFQGTLDYRATLTEAQFHNLQIEAPTEDLERFVSKRDLNSTLEQLQRLGVPTSTAPGGSPLISALTAAAWFSDQKADAVARFVGSRPGGLSGYVESTSRDVLSLAESNPVIGGTISLEYRPASTKLVLAVAEGRWLDDALADRCIDAISSGVLSLRPRRIGVGVGGLNKASLSAMQRLIKAVRELPVPAVIFATGSSFHHDIGTERPAGFWDRLLEIFATVDVISLSATEQRQLDLKWAEGWLDRLLREGDLKLAVKHSSGNAELRSAASATGWLAEPQKILAVARREATRFAGQSLTGLGARFDGVLSAAVLLNASEGLR
jgi:hypothetical protein